LVHDQLIRDRSLGQGWPYDACNLRYILDTLLLVFWDCGTVRRRLPQSHMVTYGERFV
jgi:hypothetical protein